VGPLTAKHVDAAGALVAARHAVERERCSLLPAGPSDPAVAASIVAGFEQRLPLARYARPMPRSCSSRATPSPLTSIPDRCTPRSSSGSRPAASAGIIDPVVHAPILTPAVSDGTGVGAALADAAFDWCREHGHGGACFVPVMAHLRRRLDERILTARPA